MPGGDFLVMVLLLWTLIDRGVDGGKVTGVLHGRVELRGRWRNNTDTDKVEWTKYAADNSTKKSLCVFIKPDNVTHFPSCQNINFNLQTMSLNLFNLTKEGEGIYGERITFKNNTVHTLNLTLSVQTAPKISVSCSPGSRILKCDISDDFKLLQWFKNDLPLPDDQRFSFTENNKTMWVSNFTWSDCGNYTCLISNEYGTSAAYLNVRDAACEEKTGEKTSSLLLFISEHPLSIAGFSLTILVVLCIILICIYRSHGHKNKNPVPRPEPIYDEPSAVQDEPVILTVCPVYQDFIKPKEAHQSEDFGYSTIPDVLGQISHHDPHEQ